MIFGNTEDKKFIYNFVKNSEKNSNYIFINNEESVDVNILKTCTLIIKSYECLNNKQRIELNKLLFYKIKVLTIEEWVEIYLNRIPTEIIEFNQEICNKLTIKNIEWQLKIKRLFDILFALFLLIFTSPIIIISILIIWLQDFENAIYKQIRSGKDEKRIIIYKLRSMKINSEKDGVSWASKDDPRITKFGKFLRKSRIDELPQLINVIKGDMTLIGPRPENHQLIRN